MGEEIFYLSDEEKEVRALGVKLNCQPTDIKLLINGKDVTKNLVVKSIQVIMEKKGA